VLRRLLYDADLAVRLQASDLHLGCVLDALLPKLT
jgi:hypothetical protein